MTTCCHTWAVTVYLSAVWSVSSLTQSSAQRQVVERLVNILHHVVMSVNMSGRAGEVFSRHDAVEILHRLRDVDELTVCDFTLTPTGWHKNAPPCTMPTYSLCLSLHKNVAHFVNYFWKLTSASHGHVKYSCSHNYRPMTKLFDNLPPLRGKLPHRKFFYPYFLGNGCNFAEHFFTIVYALSGATK